LIEETRKLYDGFAFLVGAFGEAPAKEQFVDYAACGIRGAMPNPGLCRMY